MRERWEFFIMQGGLKVAAGDCPTEQAAVSEAAHYAMMYGQDGPVEVKIGKSEESNGKYREQQREVHLRTR